VVYSGDTIQITKKLHFGSSLYSAVVDAGLDQDWSRAQTHFENRLEPFNFGQQMSTNVSQYPAQQKRTQVKVCVQSYCFKKECLCLLIAGYTYNTEYCQSLLYVYMVCT
jgi:hypothetical protein